MKKLLLTPLIALIINFASINNNYALTSGLLFFVHPVLSIVGMSVGTTSAATGYMMVAASAKSLRNTDKVVGLTSGLMLIIGGTIIASKKVNGHPKKIIKDFSKKCHFSKKTIQSFSNDPMLNAILSEISNLNENEALDFLEEENINNSTRKILKCYYQNFNSY